MGKRVVRTPSTDGQRIRLVVRLAGQQADQSPVGSVQVGRLIKTILRRGEQKSAFGRVQACTKLRYSRGKCRMIAWLLPRSHICKQSEAAQKTEKFGFHELFRLSRRLCRMYVYLPTQASKFCQRWSKLLPITKHVAQRAFELVHDALQTTQGDGLFTPFQPEDGGRWQFHLLGKLGERHVPTLIPQPLGQFLVQGGKHPGSMGKRSFRLRNIWVALGHFSRVLSPSTLKQVRTSPTV